MIALYGHDGPDTAYLVNGSTLGIDLAVEGG